MTPEAYSVGEFLKLPARDCHGYFFSDQVYSTLLKCLDGRASSGESVFFMGLFFSLTSLPDRLIDNYAAVLVTSPVFTFTYE